jgi:hypothetical protein
MKRRDQQHREQPSLFDEAPAARASDPSTSHEAVEAIRPIRSAAALAMLRAIREANALGVEPTALEAATRCVHESGGSVETYRKRIGDLASCIDATGQRRCNITGKQARTFRARTGVSL